MSSTQDDVFETEEYNIGDCEEKFTAPKTGWYELPSLQMKTYQTPSEVEEKIEEILKEHVYSVTALGQETNDKAKQAITALIEQAKVEELKSIRRYELKRKVISPKMVSIYEERFVTITCIENEIKALTTKESEVNHG